MELWNQPDWGSNTPLPIINLAGAGGSAEAQLFLPLRGKEESDEDQKS